MKLSLECSVLKKGLFFSLYSPKSKITFKHIEEIIILKIEIALYLPFFPLLEQLWDDSSKILKITMGL